MRFLSFSLFLSGILLLSIPAGTSAKINLSMNLFLGTSGAQVLVLQQALNIDPDTPVAVQGPGSPGNETAYFGALTKAAVIRFQEKYASEILLPAGLAKGSGYVGGYTRAKLNELLSTNGDVTIANESSAPPAVYGGNPNLKNLNVFLSAIDKVGTNRGYSSSALVILKAQVQEDIATTTDLRAAFLEVVKKSYSGALPESNLTAIISRAFRSVLWTNRARAAGGNPFGGPLLYSYYCNCSSTWLLTIGPLPPNYVTLLTYVPGSQAYLSYNIPQTDWLLGEYSGGAACMIVVGTGCASLPSEGMITPMVGSS